ncbi:receptor-like protein 15 [Panicum virgatum]|uniref:receptor-like protein 15 n=1 Tax=Panicum virgatum TaxID=38727 RepID=UPI0019D59031|nr:receptor-like protein 15 [Panicum virgatum]
MSCYFPLGTMLWVLCVLQFMSHMAGGCVIEERIALMRIKSLLLEANSEVLASWGHSDDCCSWERVRCNNSTRVSGLNLDYVYQRKDYRTMVTIGGPCWNLNLTIFSSFHELQQLDLFSNSACLQNFDGLQYLTKLRYLNLSSNILVENNVLESLAFRNLKNLRDLRLGFNQIYGSIPPSLFELPCLEYLDLSYNLLQGHIHIDLSTNLKNLQELHLGSNRLNGSIPASLFELPRLQYLDLSKNLLQGHIPKMDLTRTLKYLDLSGNLLEGHISIISPSNLCLSLQTLKLAANNLNGKFDFFWLRNCAMLKEVDLSGNAELAIDVKFLTSVTSFQLRALMLSGCNLDNTIISGPNLFGTQRHLQFLDLSNNNFSGCLPNWMFTNEAPLLYLDLAHNSLVGSLDHLMWQQQSNLQMINISMNYFTGHLPMDISSVFPNLTVLDASYNNISGYLPPSLCNINDLEFVDLSNNKLTGEVPVCLFTECGSLEFLRLSNNNLGGPILGGANNKSICGGTIFLDSNNFEGPLPNNLSGEVSIMDFHDNKLSGELDVSFWNIPSLEFLSVASNSLTGQIYPMICKLTGLSYLDISNNDFEGSIPNCSSKLMLDFLNMSSNTLSGFPSYFFNSSNVEVIDIRYNRFMGSLDWIQHLYQIKMLLLGGNMFEGHISAKLCHLQYLNIIDLSHNRLSGSLPPCIGAISFGYYTDSYDDDFLSKNIYDVPFDVGLSNMHSWFPYDANLVLPGFTFSTKGNIYTYSRGFYNLMSGIDLSANMLSGEIPWEIGNLSRVKSLNLSHNFFIGQIPATFANMSALESLDLSHNELSGSIPRQLTHMSSLEVFFAAYNNLSGCIPNSGQFSSFNMESYLGNADLQNSSKGSQCSPVLGPMEVEDVGEASDDPVLYIICAASFVLAFWATVAFLFCLPFGQRVMLQL